MCPGTWQCSLCAEETTTRSCNDILSQIFAVSCPIFLALISCFFYVLLHEKILYHIPMSRTPL